MKALVFIAIAFAAGASARVVDSLQAQFLNTSTFPTDLEPLRDTLTKYDIVCETSEASPLYWHVEWLIENLINEDKDNLCFSAMVGMASVCGDTQKKWTDKGDWNGGAVFQLCRTDMSGASNNCKGGLPGPVDCVGEKACGGYYPVVISWFLKYLKDNCWAYDSNGDPRVGGIINVKGGELRLFTMPG